MISYIGDQKCKILWKTDTDIDYTDSFDSVDDLLMLTDKYDFAILRKKCVKFLINLKDDPFLQLRIADKHELREVEVIIPVEILFRVNIFLEIISS